MDDGDNIMLDSINCNTLKINAVAGTLVKTYKDSFFLKFHSNSKLADKLFDVEPKIKVNYSEKDVVVIQTMLCSDSEMLAEVMYKKDFDKLFDNTEVNDNADKTGSYQ